MKNIVFKLGFLLSTVLWGATAAQATEYIVQLSPLLAGKSDAVLTKALTQIVGAPVSLVQKLGSLEHTYVIKTSEQVMKTKGSAYVTSALQSAPAIEWVQENITYRSQATVRPNDTLLSSQLDYLGSSKLGSILMDQAWAVSRGSYSTLIAVVDSGVLSKHPDLQGKTVPGYSFFRNSTLDKGVGPGPSGEDPGNYLTKFESDSVPSCGGADARPSDWHGTRVAAVAAATTNDAQGMAGVSWNSRILPIRALGPCGGSLSDIIEGISWAGGLPVQGIPTNPNPARVINLSFSSTATSCPAPLQDLFNRLTARNIVLVASAGNDNGLVTDPAVCKGVIAVGASTHNGLKSGFSNYGANTTIFAPGGNKSRSEGIQVANNTGTEGPSTTFNVVADTGTSFSAPIVAGVVANMLSINPQLTPVQVESILKATARPFASSLTTCPVPTAQNKSGADCACTRPNCGAGILNAFEAMQRARNLLPVPNPGAVRTVKSSNTVVDGELSSVTSGRTLAAYNWSLVSGTATLSDTASPNVTVTKGGGNAPAVLRLKVTDSAGNSSQADTAVNFVSTSTTPPVVDNEGPRPPNPGSVTTQPAASSGGGGSMSLFALIPFALLMVQMRRKSVRTGFKSAGNAATAQV